MDLRLASIARWKSAQVNQIKQVLARRAEAENVLKLLTAHPSSNENNTFEMMRSQSKRRYSIIDFVEGVISAVTTTTMTPAYQATAAEATAADATAADATAADASLSAANGYQNKKAQSIEDSSQC
jgi:hypothetical protein